MPRLHSGSSTPSLDLCWDAFPPAPPGAEDWVPDPDSIPKPGSLPDMRFNIDPCEEQRKAAFRKEFKMYNIPADVAARLKSNPRVPAVKSVLDPQPAGALLNAVYEGHLSSSTDSIPAKAYSLSTEVKEPSPAWAAPLEKMLAEEAAKSSLPSVKPLKVSFPPQVMNSPTKAPIDSTMTTKTSIPPHLRKKTKPAAHVPRSSLDPAAKIYNPRPKEISQSDVPIIKHVGDDEKRLSDEALAWKLATSDLGVEDVKQGLQLQEKMLKECNDDALNPSIQSTLAPESNHRNHNHGHWIKTRLVMIMEEDLDLSKRATKRELMAMSSDEINQYLLKVLSAHEHWWEAEQRLGSNTADDSN